jgi:hypothetical protein
MPKTNVVAIRDERGRYLKGMPGGPGRPLGSRNKLREDFFADIHAAWLERGQEVIDRVIAERSKSSCWPCSELRRSIASKLAGRRTSIGRPARRRLLRRPEQSAGPRARKCLRISWPKSRS